MGRSLQKGVKIPPPVLSHPVDFQHIVASGGFLLTVGGCCRALSGGKHAADFSCVYRYVSCGVEPYMHAQRQAALSAIPVILI